ncbi:hypothetical protein ACS0TY_029970 [Phlomoides rotata]
MHEPCGPAKMNNPCMLKNNCTKIFPKKHIEQTIVDEDGYPLYKRRNNGRTVNKTNVDLDNGYVVHINVEWCNKHKSIKYLFKYINKGLNRVTTAVVQNMDREDDSTSKDEMNRMLHSSEANYRIVDILSLDDIQQRKGMV